jgi:excisionase family DNA binding protein
MNKARALTVSEICAWLGLSKPTALKLLKNGEIPAAKLGKSWRISQQVIESLLCGGKSGEKRSSEPDLPRAA